MAYPRPLAGILLLYSDGGTIAVDTIAGGTIAANGLPLHLSRRESGVDSNASSLGSVDSQTLTRWGVDSTDEGVKMKKGKKRPLSGYEIPEVPVSCFISDLGHDDGRY